MGRIKRSAPSEVAGTTKAMAGPDVDGWSAADESYTEVVKLAEDGVTFALGHEAKAGALRPSRQHVAA
jgi:hypothetical protein